jgi:diaminopimelate epimerase
VSSIQFVKGHGTRNDFVVLDDPEDRLDLTPVRVRALCDRRSGLGGDGVLRIVRSSHAGPEVDTTGTEWFMDHRNADGSLAEMCGNGIRVFTSVLVESGRLRAGTADLATRGGVRRVQRLDGDLVSVDMGAAGTPHATARARVTVGERSWEATAVLMPNPHAVVFVDDLADAGDLRAAPAVTPASIFPDGVNVEFVAGNSAGHVSMRVHERGVGETQSCGTGACAAAWAWRRRGDETTAPRSVRVDVPGGTLLVTEQVDGRIELQGPATLVGRGEVDPTWWKAQV